MRIVLIGFVIVVIIIGFGLAIRFNQDARYAQGELNEERHQRFLSEENLQKANIQINTLEKEIQRLQDRIVSAESALEKIQIVNKDLMARLDKAAEIKVNLDKKIAELQALTP